MKDKLGQARILGPLEYRAILVDLVCAIEARAHLENRRERWTSPVIEEKLAHAKEVIGDDSWVPLAVIRQREREQQLEQMRAEARRKNKP